jgi:hypothetical protein
MALMSAIPFALVIVVGFLILVWAGWLDHCSDDDCDERHDHR